MTAAYTYGSDGRAAPLPLRFRGAARGSTTITANADGSLQSEMRYTAFGEVRTSSGTMPTNYQYTGQLKQAELGLYFYVSRFYDPYLNHFVQADSIVPEAGSAKAYDRYAYVNNNPVKGTDSSGHCLDGLTTIPCLMALIAITSFAGGAAVHEFNDSGHSWWESPQEAADTFKAGMDAFVLAVGIALGVGTATAGVDTYLQSRANPVFNTEAGRVAKMVDNMPADEAITKLEEQGYKFGKPELTQQKFEQIKGVNPLGDTEVRLHGPDPRYPNDPAGLWRISTNFGSVKPSQFSDKFIQEYQGNHYVYVNQFGQYGPYLQSADKFPSTHFAAVPPTNGIWPFSLLK